MWSLVCNSLLAICTTMVALVLSYHFYLKSFGGMSKKIRIAGNRKDTATWLLGERSYQAFVAVCDTFIPSMSSEECSVECIREAMSMIHPRFLSHPEVLSPEHVTKFTSFLCAGALDYGTHKHCMAGLERTATKNEKRLLAIVIFLLSTHPGNLILTGFPLAFQDLPLWAREKALRNLRDSKFIPLKSLYHAFKRLIIGVYFSFAEPGIDNPCWGTLQYEPSVAVKSIEQFQESDELKNNMFLRQKVSLEAVADEVASAVLDDKVTFEVDVVIVGSGCGGGVVAHQLVQAGYRVLVLEKGGFYQTDDFAKWKECDAFTHAFDKGGLCTSNDGGVVILAGSCVGGGSTVNWSASFAPPKHVLEDWVSMGLSQFSEDNEIFNDSLGKVKELFHINSENSFYNDKSDETFQVNLNNKLLWKASQMLGYTPEKIPRNVRSCVDCGNCSHGCSHKAKQSTWNALLEPIILKQYGSSHPSERQGTLHVIPNCFVEKVVFQSKDNLVKVASGVIARGLTRDGGWKRIEVNAKVVVSACGSIHTPALLLRSGCKHNLIGKYLSLHPVIGTGGMLSQDQNTGLATGVSMGVVVRNPPIISKTWKSGFTHYKPERYPVAIETPPVHMGILGLILPWNSGLQLKITSLGWKQFAAFLGISRDVSSISNRVDIDRDGNPVIHYSIAEEDKANLLAGLEAQIRFQRAIGAKVIFYGHSNSPWFVESANDDKAFEEYVERIRSEGVQPLDMQILSAHQMSSCRMANSSAHGPVKPNGSLYECDNLFVADGSVLPTSLGINPMLTIFTISHMIAKHIISQLKQ